MKSFGPDSRPMMISAPGDKNMQPWRLRDADRTLRLFITAFLALVTAGYAVGLSYVGHTTSNTVHGLSEQFRGTPESSSVSELKYAKSADEMSILLHNHVLSLSLVFFCVGGVFYFSSLVNPGIKRFLMIEPIAAIATTFGGIWLVRFVSSSFSWLVLVSGVSMAGCLAVMALLILWALWMKR